MRTMRKHYEAYNDRHRTGFPADDVRCGQAGVTDKKGRIAAISIGKFHNST